MTGVALGIDVGGSSTRALAVDAGGAVVGRGTAGGANPNTNGPAHAAAQVLSAACTALGERPVAACVIGMAGVSTMKDPAVAAEFQPVFELLRPRLVSDAEVAFASGTAAPHGTVLISGTGSIAMRIVHRARDATSGGFGWLLGDEGSAYWIGREAVRATLRMLQSGDVLGPLARSVVSFLPAEDDQLALFGKLIRAVNREAPIRLARFAPLVCEVDDPVAAGIVERAAQSLSGQAIAVHDGGPVVLAGAVMRTIVGTRVRELLAGREVAETRDGVLGAAWLAAVDAFGEDAIPPS
ncbi:N-acetylglucosamine kinase [Actinokineospora inagensis]|uniref:N-acetylglucosamine kinase n=1 Tax=Actinokineospora inagensis TaxID=103730 RepID=UPI0003F7A2F1|nr:BadF/BadG/BcrA/BcrD ATPase family protein [Actinokineospora inagensis]